MNEATLSHLRNIDPILGQLIARIGPMTFEPSPERSPFKCLVTSIAHQQLSGKAANTILKRFIDLWPGADFPTPEQVLAVEADRIRAAGFSRPKVSYIRDIAEKTVAGIVPASREIHRMGDEEIVERLTSIKGVGRWTVEMLLIFKLGRPDVLPIHDLGVRKGFARAFRKRKLPAPEQLAKHGERWRPYRTTASWYLWRAADAED